MKMATLMMKKRSGVSMRFVMMVALMATCFVHQLHARNNIIDFLAATELEGGYGYAYRSIGSSRPDEKDWCEGCFCTFSIPPQCQCLDAGVSCYAECDRCVCNLSEPPQCRCLDVRPYCPLRCPTASHAIASSTHTDPTA